MRPLQLATLAAVVVAAVGSPASAAMVAADPAASSGHPGVHLTGTVTDESGDPVADASVLIQPANATAFEELALSRSIHDGFRKLAESGGTDEVTVVQTDAEGRYETSLDVGEYELVAVTDDGLSMVRQVDASDGGTVETDLELDPDRVQPVDGADVGHVTAGNETSVTVRVANVDDEPIRNASLSVSIPDEFTVVDVETDGRWNADSRTLTWETVPAGSQVTATIRVRVAEDAPESEYRIAYAGGSDTHLLQTTNPSRVSVRPPGATPTHHPGGGDGTPTPTAMTEGPHGEGPLPMPAPGFGSVAAVAALLATALAAGRRTR